MGLDALELVLNVEDAFDVRIPDERLGEIETVGDLHDFVVSLKGNLQPTRDTCLSASTFFRIRRALCRLLTTEPRGLRPRTPLDDVLPKDHRRELWTRLRRELKLTLPSLVRPRWLVCVSLFIVFLVTGAVAYFAYRSSGPVLAAVGGIAVFALAGFLVLLATAPMATRVGSGFTTLRELSQFVLAHNHAALATELQSWNAADMWETLRVIIAEQLGIKAEDVARNARFRDMP